MKIKITSDSTCDLSPELIEKHNIRIIPLFVNMGGKSYLDSIDIHPSQIFANTAATGELSSTAAVPVGTYEEVFSEILKEYDAIIHIDIGSGFSSCYQNACIASADMPNVRIIDSRNLSTGQGHVVMEACRMVEEGLSLDDTVKALNELIPKVDASFLLDRLDYMVKGGRCSAVAAFGANLLKLKPCIEVIDNKMIVGKKYRGNYTKCMEKYVLDRLQDKTDIRLDRVFITHTVVSEEISNIVHSTVRKCLDFEDIFDTEAGCTISCHCGEGTLGVLYIHK